MPAQSPRSAVNKKRFSMGLKTYSAGSFKLSYGTPVLPLKLGRGDDPPVGLGGTRHSFESEFFVILIF